MGKHPRGLVHRLLQRLIRHLAQALQGVRRAGAARARDERVVVALPALDVADGSEGAGLHERAAEEAFGVAAVGDHVQGGGDRARALAPAVRLR